MVEGLMLQGDQADNSMEGLQGFWKSFRRAGPTLRTLPSYTTTSISGEDRKKELVLEEAMQSYKTRS